MKSNIYILLLILVCNLEQVQAQAYEKYDKSIYLQSVPNKGKRLEIVPFPSELNNTNSIKGSSEVLLHRLRNLDIERAELASALETNRKKLDSLKETESDVTIAFSLAKLEKTYRLSEDNRDSLMTELGKSLTNSSFCLWFWYSNSCTFSDLFCSKEEVYARKWKEKADVLKRHYMWRSVNQDSIKIIDNVSIQGLTDRGVFYSELFEDAFNTVQPMRVSIGTTIVSTKGDSTGEKQAIQKILSGGGNFTLNLSTPLLYAKTPNIC